MRKLLYPAALSCLLLAASCSKDDDNTPTPTPQPVSVNGYFSIQYDSTLVKIDSMRTYYLNAVGTLDSATTVGKYDWKSPARRYESGDSAYASVMAWGSAKSIGVSAAEMKFSESVVSQTLTRTQSSIRQNNKAGYTATYGFRLK